MRSQPKRVGVLWNRHFSAFLLGAAIFSASSVAPASLRDDPKLIAAAISGDLVTARKLLAAGANPDSIDSNHHTPLDLAAFTHHLDIVKALLAHHASLDSHNPDGVTPLMFAAGSGAPRELL